jgi:predicted ATPase
LKVPATRGSAFDDRRVVRSVVANDDAPGTYDVWPADIPAVEAVLREGLDLAPGVTMLVGENGSGKSTIVEAVAMAFGLSPEGGTPYGHHSSHRTESPLHRWLRLERSPGAPRWGFFLRAETMHGYYTYLHDVGGAPSSPPCPGRTCSRSANGGCAGWSTTTWRSSTTGGATSTSR